jgi:DNA-binding LacI/PurR family transcriptional regulator
MVTLKDVAKEAGVSAHSVSAVLNGKAKQYRISQATCDRILEMAREMGYDPDDNRSARQMAARKHGTKILNNVIAVCTVPAPTPLHDQPFESMILSGIESMADEHDLDVLQCRLRPARMPRLIEKGEVDGVIMLSSNAEHFRAINRLNLPIVKIGSSYPSVHSVSAEHYRGIYLVTSHLTGLGHRNLAFIGHDINRSPDDSTLADAAAKRLAGFRGAMSEVSGTQSYEECTLRDSYPEDGERSFVKLWERSKGTITGVVCYNDTLAIGVVNAAQKMGLQVPRDLSVVGFDNISQSFKFEPHITSAHFDRHQMGIRSVEIVLKMREFSGNTESQYIRDELLVKLVEGATTAAPRGEK